MIMRGPAKGKEEKEISPLQQKRILALLNLDVSCAIKSSAAATPAKDTPGLVKREVGRERMLGNRMGKKRP